MCMQHHGNEQNGINTPEKDLFCTGETTQFQPSDRSSKSATRQRDLLNKLTLHDLFLRSLDLLFEDLAQEIGELVVLTQRRSERGVKRFLAIRQSLDVALFRVQAHLHLGRLQ